MFGFNARVSFRGLRVWTIISFICSMWSKGLNDFMEYHSFGYQLAISC